MCKNRRRRSGLISDKRNSKVAVTMRVMEEADLPVVVGIEREIFPDPWPLSAFAEQLADNSWHTLVAESDGGIIGYACCLLAAGECHLANIAVHPAWRRKSVAKQLLDHILKVAGEGGCHTVLLEVRPSNEEAIAFYRRFGFEKLYQRPRYYSRPKEDALVMVRGLDAPVKGE